MADDRLRELERRYRERGTPEDEALWHAARLRAGQLSLERLELAAHLGHPSAAMALAQLAAEPEHETAPTQNLLARLLPRKEKPRIQRFVPPLEAWARGLQRWGREACVRAALAAVEQAVGAWEDSAPRAPGLAETRERLQAAREALEAGEPERVRGPAWDLIPQREGLNDVGSRALQACAGLQRALTCVEEALANATGLAVRRAADAVQLNHRRQAGGLAQLAVLGANHVREAVRAALIPWALGLD